MWTLIDWIFISLAILSAIIIETSKGKTKLFAFFIEAISVIWLVSVAIINIYATLVNIDSTVFLTAFSSASSNITFLDVILVVLFICAVVIIVQAKDTQIIIYTLIIVALILIVMLLINMELI